MCFGSDSDTPQAPRPRRQRQRQGGGQQGVELQNRTISGPVTPPGQVPAPQRDERGIWLKYPQYELSRQNILKALSYAAQYINERGQNVTVVAVGGAVNTVFLQTRNTTHDVDFFCPLLAEPTLGIVREAGQYAIERSSVPLAPDWLNNATARMPGVVEHVDALQTEANAQRDVLFSKPGLTVVAAPWNYAFIKKVSRITQGTRRHYDASDAVAYLHQYITKVHSNKPVPLAKMSGGSNTRLYVQSKSSRKSMSSTDGPMELMALYSLVRVDPDGAVRAVLAPLGQVAPARAQPAVHLIAAQQGDVEYLRWGVAGVGRQFLSW